MRRTQLTEGFSAVEAILVVLIVAGLGLGGWYAWHENKTKPAIKQSASQTNKNSSATKSSSSSSSADLYADWQTYCDSSISSCIQYPSDWSSVPGFPGDFQNSTNTGYVSLSPGTVKDRAEDTVYIQSVEEITTTTTPLSIVGYIDNNKPGYGVYDASYVASSGIKAGATMQLVDGNYAFSGKAGDVSLVATPGAAGYAAITTLTQAQGWFSTADARTCLKILKSFYYQ